MTPIKLGIWGILANKIETQFKMANVFCDKNEYDLILVCDYSENDIPIGYSFNVITNSESERLVECVIILQEVSQQFFKHFDNIPRGWKTICRYEFKCADMEEIKRLFPQVDNWCGDLNKMLYLSHKS